MKPNFDPIKEEAEQLGNEWQFGSFSQPAIVTIPVTERNLWLPTGENQFDQITDFQDCASRSPCNHLEMLFSYHYAHNMKQDNKAWLESKGYIVNGKVTFSKRFIATLSGTTHTGNSLKAPLDSIRKQGLIPESLLPQSDTMTWDEYYQIIPQNLIDLGKEFLTRFSVNYEQVNQVHFPDLLQDDMIGVAGHAWNDPVNGVYEKTSDPINHAFLLYSTPDYQIVDNYTPYTKTISPDYTFYAYGYRVYISSETVPQDTSTLTTLLNQLLTALTEWYNKNKPVILPTIMTSNQTLAEAAKSFLGKDASPLNRAPQELSCAEGVVNIVNSAFPGTLSKDIIGTAVLFSALKNNSKFKGVLDPKVGTIVVTPSSATQHGHCGIYTQADVIASNDSTTGLFKENYTRETWRSKIMVPRGLKGYLFDLK